MWLACPSRLLSMTQEHGRVEPISGQLDYSKYPLGSLLTLIPYHVSTEWFIVHLIDTSVLLHIFLLSDNVFFSAVMCNSSDASCVPCTLQGSSGREVDAHSRVVKSWTMSPPSCLFGTDEIYRDSFQIIYTLETHTAIPSLLVRCAILMVKHIINENILTVGFRSFIV